MSAIEAIKNGTIRVVTIRRDEIDEVWNSIQENNEKSEELADAINAATEETGSTRYILIEITP